jgi:uncharacterized protein
MPQFVLSCHDAADALPRRMAVREAHLEWVKSTTALKVLAAGPLLDDDGGFAGSLFIVEASSKADVVDWHGGDPYVANNVFERVELLNFRWAINPPPG